MFKHRREPTLAGNAGSRTRPLLMMGLLFISFGLLTAPIGGGTPNCLNGPPHNPNPPPLVTGVFDNGNPNPCHIYTWNNFPIDFGVTPQMGLFNNDTSYYFSYNLTGVTGFEVCGTFMSRDNFISGGNETIVLQYLSGSTGDFKNVDPATNPANQVPGSVGAGDLVGGPNCGVTASPTNIGTVSASVGTDCVSTFDNNRCEMRLAGNQGVCYDDCSFGGQTDTLQFSELHVIFFYGGFTIRNVITCTATAISTTSFTNSCAKNIANTSSQAITVRWEANNLGLAFQSGTTTCTITAGNTACANSITFAPAFAATPSIVETWSAVAGTPNFFTYTGSGSSYTVIG